MNENEQKDGEENGENKEEGAREGDLGFTFRVEDPPLAPIEVQNSHENEKVIHQHDVVRALESPTFGRQFIDGQEHADHSVAQEDSKSDANDDSDQIGLDVYEGNKGYDSNRASGVASGLNIVPLKLDSEEEDDNATYIVPRKGGQGKNVNFLNAAAPNVQNETGEDATYMIGPNRQAVYQTGIQDRTPVDVTAELTYIAGHTANFKKETPGTFGEIACPSEVILETEFKMFSQNEERIKHELEESTKEDQSKEKDKKTPKLEEIIAKESTNLQWWKLSVNFGMLIIMLILMIGRGPGNEPSVIGISPCDGPDFILLLVMILAAGTMTFIAIVFTREEYQEKVDAGYTFVKGDQEFTTPAVIKLILIALLGAFLAATCGISTGAIFFPVLI